MAFAPSQRALAQRYYFDQQLNMLRVMKSAFQRGIDASASAAAESATAFMNSLNEYKSGKGGSRSLQSAFQRVMNDAQEATLASYDERVTNAPDRLAPYRVGQNRNAGGALRRAIADPAMFSASYQGFAFINTSILDREANHWARLNFGAGGIASSGYPRAPARKIVIFGQQLGPIGAPEGSPRPGFMMPFGIWVGSGEHPIKWGGRPPGFYPLRKELTHPTKGIAARRFFDAAYTAIAESMPIETENLLHEWADQASRTFKGLGARAAARALSGGIGNFVGGASAASAYSAA